jgi:ADP-heptose:LPS heptosyltransferase
MAKHNLLVIHHGALGDVVATFPALLKLKKKYGRLKMLCEGRIGELARFLDIVDDHFPMEAGAFATLYSSRVDPVVKNILLEYDKIVLFSRARDLQNRLFSITEKPVCRIQPKPHMNQNVHVAEHVLSHLVRCGLLEKADVDRGTLSSSAVHPDRRDPNFDRSRILIHPGSGSRKKCWPVSNFIRIARLLRARSWRPEFILGPAEDDLADILTREFFQQNEYSGNVHRMDNLTELALGLKASGGFIGNDSGVSHLSAFLGLPTVAVFGPSDPQRWRPVGRHVTIVRPALDCSPCFETDSAGCEEMECLTRTSPEDVLAAYFRLAGCSKPAV